MNTMYAENKTTLTPVSHMLDPQVCLLAKASSLHDFRLTPTGLVL